MTYIEGRYHDMPFFCRASMHATAVAHVEDQKQKGLIMAGADSRDVATVRQASWLMSVEPMNAAPV